MQTLRILVIDNQPGLSMAADRALRDFVIDVPDVNVKVAFHIEAVETGETALQRIADGPPDIILLDYQLPGMNGLEVLEQLEAQRFDLVAIMVTAYASIDIAVAATKRGAYDFLTKPFTPVQLRHAVSRAAHRLLLARQARQLAEEKRQVRFQFIRVLGHELKAPLNAVEGYLQIALTKGLGSDIAAYNDFLERSVARIEGMRKLISDLLDMTRIESGQKSRELAELDLQQLANEAIELAGPAARDAGIAIELHADGPLFMQADRGEIEMIFNNLVSNAVKYNRPQGRVDVTLTTEDDFAVIEVADTGIGMTAEEAAKLFGEFVRIKNAKTRNILGSGLGLSIVKKLAELYEGTATCTSQPDVGSTFTVKLKRE